MNELAEIIISLTGSKSNIVHKPIRPGEIENTILIADTKGLNEKIKENYSFKDLKEGLKETIEYYKEIPQSHIDSFFKYYQSDEHDKYYINSRSSK